MYLFSLNTGRVGRLFVSVSSLGIVVASVTACSPDTQGAIALAKDGGGDLVAVVVTCGARFEGVELMSEPGNGNDERVGVWRNSNGIKDGSELPLTQGPPPGDWLTVLEWDGVLLDSYSYEIRAGRLADGGGIDFSAPVSSLLAFNGSDLASLDPGELIRRDYAGDSGNLITAQESVDDFHDLVCANSN